MFPFPVRFVSCVRFLVLIVLVVLSSSATAQDWRIIGGGPGYDTGWSLGMDSLGNSYVLAFTDNTTQFPDTTIVWPYPSLFGAVHAVLKYDSTGQLVNTMALEVGPMHMAVDSIGNVYATGAFVDEFHLPTGSISALPGYAKLVIVKWNTAGDLEWYRLADLDSDVESEGKAIMVLPDGDVLVTVATTGSVFFDEDTIQGLHALMRLNPAGEIEWTKFSPSSFLGQDQQGNYYTCGGSGVWKWNSADQLVWSTDTLPGMVAEFAVSPMGEIVVAIQDPQLLIKYGLNHEREWTRSNAGRIPRFVTVAQDGTVFFSYRLDFECFIEQIAADGIYVNELNLGVVPGVGGIAFDVNGMFAHRGTLTYVGEFSGGAPFVFLGDTFTGQGSRDFACFRLALSQMSVGTGPVMASKNVAGISIYPNPATGTFIVKLAELVNNRTVLRIYDLNGRLCLRQRLHNQSERVDLSGWKPGQYVVNVTASDLDYSTVLIVQ